MKKNVLTLACLSTFLVACDSAILIAESTTENPSAIDNTGGTTDGGSSAGGTGLDGITTSSTANGIVRNVGLIKLEPIGISTDSTRGLFGALPDARTEQEIREWYIPSTDTCLVTLASDEESTSATDEFLVLDQNTTLVSAGESLVLTDDNGTYATLQQTTGLSGPVYQPESDLDQSAGMNLSIDVPGDQFAAFPDIAVPSVSALSVEYPTTDAKVEVATFFQWTPNDVPGSIIELYSSGLSTSSNQQIFIGCSLVDDGEFGFPADVQALMGDGYDDDWTTILRIAYNVAAEGDTMVFVANSVRSD